MVKLKRKKKKTDTKKNLGVWEGPRLTEIYELARKGLSNSEIAATIGLTIHSFNKSICDRPQAKYFLQAGRKTLKGEMEAVEKRKPEPVNLKHLLYKSLPTHLKRYWDKIMEWQDTPNPATKIDAMMQEGGSRVRKSLFIHALQYYNFKIKPALTTLNISHYEYESWLKGDREFLEVIDEMVVMKGDFFEDALMNLVATGSVPAILFANKTYNAQRGYSEKIDVNVSGEVNHNVTLLGAEDLEVIPLEYRKKLLERIDTKEITVNAVAV